MCNCVTRHSTVTVKRLLLLMHYLLSRTVLSSSSKAFTALYRAQCYGVWTSNGRALMMMAQHTHNSNGDSSTTLNQLSNVFHDFMGMKNTTESPLLFPSKAASDASLSTSASLGTSDLASSERQVRGHLEGVPFYGPRNGPESSSKLTGYKRSNLDSTFMMSYRDGVRQHGPDSRESSRLMKTQHNGEQPRRFSDEEAIFGIQIMRPTSSLLLQHPAGSRIDANMSVNPAVQYPPRGSQFSPLTHKVTQNKFRDPNAFPSVISQAAADEGSRTGMKGSGIFSSASEQNTPRSHPESSIPPSGHGLTSACSQMTIFYGGQPHVFDDVHPNKADIIMALARSNGGSWSTMCSPKSAPRMGSESCMPAGENGRLLNAGNSSHQAGSSDQPGGGDRGQASENGEL